MSRKDADWHKAPPESLEAAGLEYVHWLEQTHYSSETVRLRRRQLHYFFEWCEIRSLYQPGEITRPILERYQRWLFTYRKANGQPLGIGSQRSRLLSVKHYFRHLARNHVLVNNPASEIVLPKLGVRLPKQILSVEEVETVLSQPDLDCPFGLRDRTIMELLYCCGLRRLEITKLTLYSVDFGRGLVFVEQGKGRKDRVVPIADRAARWTRKYLAEARPELVAGHDPGFLFLSRTGKQLGPDYLSNRIRNHIEAAAVDKPGSCHVFRHTVATLMLENGADVRYVQELLGHSSLETTQVYTRVSATRLKAVHELTHPTCRPPDKS